MAVEERDPYTGYLTTGHKWNGITELNRPVPKPVWYFLSAAFLFAVICWILMPAWPLGDTYTHGTLHTDQRKEVAEKLATAKIQQAKTVQRIRNLDFVDIAKDPALLRYVQQVGSALFGDNCSVCHGQAALGGPGFPSLVDKAWLWGGTPETISETIRVGINSDHSDSRVSQMLAFGRDGLLTRSEISDVVSYVRTLGNRIDATDLALGNPENGQIVFADNCAACHGDTGEGNTDIGAPDLTDKFWIYGGDRKDIHQTVMNGRTGHMPSWEGRLDLDKIKVLTLYLKNLADGK